MQCEVTPTADGAQSAWYLGVISRWSSTGGAATACSTATRSGLARWRCRCGSGRGAPTDRRRARLRLCPAGPRGRPGGRVTLTDGAPALLPVPGSSTARLV